MGWPSMVTKICSHSPWCLHHIYCKWYFFALTQRYVISISTQRTQPCSRAFFLGRQTNSTESTGRYSIEWAYPCGMQNHQKRYGISSGRWDWHMLHQCLRAATNPCMWRINGPSTRPNSSAGWQYHDIMVCEKNYQAKNVKSNWHDILLAPRQKGSRTIHNLLDPQ